MGTTTNLYVTGKYYRVPCVEAEWGREFHLQRRLWVIMLPLHDDKEHLDFKNPHYHLHPQFLPKRFYNLLSNNGRYLWIVHPLQHNYECVGWNKNTREFDIDIDRPMGEVVYRTRRCLRAMPEHPVGTGDLTNQMVRDFQRAFVGQRIANGKCPHRGIDLSRCPVKNGCVVCPGHGLLFRNGVCEFPTPLRKDVTTCQTEPTEQTQ